MNSLLRFAYSGTRSTQHPDAPFKVYFDGYRLIGWTLGGLHASESSEFTFVRALLKVRPCKCVWDIGANIGLWSLFFAGIEPPIEQIICFEPDETNLRYLRMNKERNGITPIDIRAMALSSKSGQMTFYADPMTGATGTLEVGADFLGKNYHASRHEVVVSVSTVDEQVANGTPAPEFMKIDVEKHEPEVLRGASAVLRQFQPMLILEVSRRHDEVTSLMREFNYRLIDPVKRCWIDRPQFSTLAVPAKLSDAVSTLLRN